MPVKAHAMRLLGRAVMALPKTSSLPTSHFIETGVLPPLSSDFITEQHDSKGAGRFSRRLLRTCTSESNDLKKNHFISTGCCMAYKLLMLPNEMSHINHTSSFSWRLRQ
jgi:hypothetical protein